VLSADSVTIHIRNTTSNAITVSPFCAARYQAGGNFKSNLFIYQDDRPIQAVSTLVNSASSAVSIAAGQTGTITLAKDCLLHKISSNEYAHAYILDQQLQPKLTSQTTELALLDYPTAWHNFEDGATYDLIKHDDLGYALQDAQKKLHAYDKNITISNNTTGKAIVSVFCPQSPTNLQVDTTRSSKTEIAASQTKIISVPAYCAIAAIDHQITSLTKSFLPAGNMTLQQLKATPFYYANIGATAYSITPDYNALLQAQ
jgi:hypothetical protein